MSENKFKVATDVFEGPLELLLELIEKRKLFISDVSLAKVADDYIKHVEKMQQFDVPGTAHFVVVASTLLLIKSKSLLPGLELTQEEESDIEDLERRLKVYKRMKGLSKHVRERFESQIMFERSAPLPVEPRFLPDDSITKDNLHQALKKLVQALPTTDTLSQAVVEKVISLEEMIDRLAGRIQKGLSMKFGEFTQAQKQDGANTKEAKVNLIVGFLAMLELVKQGSIAVRQSGRFADIQMESRHDPTTPDYA